MFARAMRHLAALIALAGLAPLAALSSGCQPWGPGGWNAGPAGGQGERAAAGAIAPAGAVALAGGLEGRVDFPPARTAQAVASDVVIAATVTFVHTGTNTAVASTITRGDGSFRLDLGGFTPENRVAYLVEATKGLGAYRPGQDAPRFRTLVLFDGSVWQSTSTPKLVINALTTAVAVESGLDPTGVPPADTMNKVNVSGPTPGLEPTPAFAGHPDDEILRLAVDVVASLAGDADPVGAVSRLDPAIADMRPKTGKAGDLVAVEGSGFSPVAGGNTVKFNGVAATVLVATPARLVVEVPNNAASGPVSVQTSRGSAAATGPDFAVVTPAAVSISEIAPPHAATGSVVTVYGAGFRTTAAKNTVSFAKSGGGTVNAEVVAADSNSLAVRVPDNAASGLIQVSLPDGVASNRAWFTVDTPAKPTVTAVVPNVGAPGQEVRFEGSGFGSSEGLAVFGWAEGRYAGEVVSWTDSAVTAKLPPNTGIDVLAYLYGPFGELMAPQLFKYLTGNPRQSGGETNEAYNPAIVLSANHAGGWYSVIGRYWYVGAGFGGSTAVARVPIGDDGTLGEFTPVVARAAIPVFSTAFSNVDSLVVGNYAYIFGGIQQGVGGIDAIQVARILTSDGASISNFVVSPVRLARPIDGNPVLKIGKYVYIFGNGWEQGFTYSEYQRISFDDTGLIQKVEKFRSAERISSPWGQAVRVHRSDQGYDYQEQDFVYLMGGGWPKARRILRASVNPDGTLGPFADSGKSLARDFYAGSVYATDKAIYVFNGDRSMCNVTKMDISGNGDISNAYCYATSGNELQYSAVARLGRHFYVIDQNDGGQRLRDFTIQ